MNSPRFAPAGLLVRCGDAAVAIDGGPGAEPPGAVDGWLVTDEHAELRAALRRLARARGMPAPAVAEHVAGALAVRPFPVEHTSHPAYGYRISARGQIAVWAPGVLALPVLGGPGRPAVRRGRRLGPSDPLPRRGRRPRLGCPGRRRGSPPRRPPPGVRAHRPTLTAGHGRRAAAAVRRMGRRGQNLHHCGLGRV